MLVPAAAPNTSLLSAGTLLIQESVVLPESLKIETSIYSSEWRIVITDQPALDAKIAAAGWHFFFIVGTLEGSAFGRVSPMNLDKALRRILRQVQELHFNAVEIAWIKSHCALGLIPYISISAHARNLQRSEQLDSK